MFMHFFLVFSECITKCFRRSGYGNTDSDEPEETATEAADDGLADLIQQTAQRLGISDPMDAATFRDSDETLPTSQDLAENWDDPSTLVEAHRAVEGCADGSESEEEAEIEMVEPLELLSRTKLLQLATSIRLQLQAQGIDEAFVLCSKMEEVLASIPARKQTTMKDYFK